jgi:hypothetical protein
MNVRIARCSNDRAIVGDALRKAAETRADVQKRQARIGMGQSGQCRDQRRTDEKKQWKVSKSAVHDRLSALIGLR